MFYSDTLLSKTGPLARVWLAANMERKLTKANILQTDVEDKVHQIIDTGQAPIALRLSAHLLLGVVRIYSRKARYLLDDCNEALMKIKLVCLTFSIPLSQARSAFGTDCLTRRPSAREMSTFQPAKRTPPTQRT